MKKLLAILLSAVLALSLAACGDSHAPDTMSLDDFALIRESDGAVISYGMTRAEIEKLLGESARSDSTGTSSYEGGLSITYREYPFKRELGDNGEYIVLDKENPLPQEEQVAVSIYTSSVGDDAGGFKTVRGITLDADWQEVLDAYGEKYAQIKEPIYIGFYYDLKNQTLLPEEPDAQQKLQNSNSLLWMDFAFQNTDDKNMLWSISMYDLYFRATTC